MTSQETLPVVTAEVARSGMMALKETAERVQQQLAIAEGFDRAIAMAVALQELNAAMTPETVVTLRALAGTDVGFKCDTEELAAETIKNCVIRALMHGANIVGNEFNIIAGECYLTQAFYRRKLREYPGVANVVVEVSVPEKIGNAGRQVLMACSGHASCLVDGKKVEVRATKDERGDLREFVKAFEGDIDAARGKVRKRLYQRLYERVAGVVIEDEAPANVVVVDANGEDRKDSMDIRQELIDDLKSEPEKALEIGRLLWKSPTPEARKDVLAAAREHLKNGVFTTRAYDKLVRLAQYLDEVE